MAKQRIMHGATLDTVTPEELADLFNTPPVRPRLALGSTDIEHVFDDVPVKGIRAQTTSWNRGDGSDNFVLAAATFYDLTSERVGRIAGSIINVGTNPCNVYLAKASAVSAWGYGKVQGIFCGYLTASGGSWDLKVSDEVWCGPISVYSAAGTTLVWGVH